MVHKGTLRLIDDPLILYTNGIYDNRRLRMPLIVLYVIKLIESHQERDKIAYSLTGIGLHSAPMLRDLDLTHHEYPQPFHLFILGATVLYLIQHLWFAIKEENQIAKWFGWAFGALIFTIVNDILYTLEVILIQRLLYQLALYPLSSRAGHHHQS